MSLPPRPTTPRALLLALILVAVGPEPLPTPSSPPLAPSSDRDAEEREARRFPNDWFLLQRAWPHDDIRQASRLAAWQAARALQDAADAPAARASWTFAGPTNVGGRIADVACHPVSSSVCWVGAAEGGVLKTTDGGTTWIPQMDFESSLSIGDLAVDPTNPDILYVGTGEPNGGGGSVTYGGTGVFKSTDGGSTWTNVGLPDSRYIGRVVVDPSNPSRVFVAVVGSLFSKNAERGVYRSTDAGANWSHVLALNDSTGAVDVVVHPTNSNLVYAATWERTRRPDNIYYGGDGCGIYRSLNGGDTWTELTSGLPTGPTVGRIGLAIAPSSPDILYAIYAEADPGAFMGLYKTTNGGTSWTRTTDAALSDVYASYGWWFGQVRVSPSNPNTVFAVGYDLYRSTNGGGSWSNVGLSMHVDHHGLDFAPSGAIYEGNDGGMYKSTNGGTSWAMLPNLPVTQFYAIDVDQSLPQRLYGGAQDNGTSRTLTGALDDWGFLLGGDGFTPLVDPVNNAYVYAEFQYGGLYRSTNGGSTFLPAGGISGRINWSMPVVFDPSNPATVYCASERVYRSTNRAASFSAISPDLSNGPGGGNRVFGTVTTIAVAPTNSAVIWAGTDDSNVWVTTNSGTSWTEVSAALPARWVTRVAVDPTAANVSYVTISGFRWDEPLPHVFRSTSWGATWSDISANLPEAPVNDLVVDPQSTSTLYVATDFGVYRSTDVGGSWSAFGSGLPNVVVSDLRLHAPTHTLVAGTYGRSMWKLDLTQATAAPVWAALGAEGGPQLHAVAPNPASAGPVAIRFTLPREADVSLRIVDVAGRVVATVAEGRRGAGDTTLRWDRRDASGAPAVAGVYFVRLEADGVVRTTKLTLVRP
jgi:photosystem II stability/assembly factor-like uncharacterized protein